MLNISKKESMSGILCINFFVYSIFGSEICVFVTKCNVSVKGEFLNTPWHTAGLLSSIYCTLRGSEKALLKIDWMIVLVTGCYETSIMLNKNLRTKCALVKIPCEIPRTCLQ